MNSLPQPLSPTRIVWLTAGSVTGPLLESAVELASPPGLSVVVVSQGEKWSRKRVAPGVTMQVLVSPQLAQGPLSWDLAGVVARCDLVHLFDPCSLSAALALLAARLRGIPVVATCPAVSAGLWAALDLRRLAAWVVPGGASAAELSDVYRMVLATRREAA
jgi:hypothetical protein